MSIPIETVNTGDFTMRFFRFGEGERPLVILPGLSIRSVMESADLIEHAYRIMRKDFTVYVFDRREAPPSPYSVRDMARDTAEAMRVLGLRGVSLFGASQGGMIAMEIAAAYPELVTGLALGSTSAHVRPRQYRALAEWVRLAKEKDRAGLYLSFGEKIYPPAVFKNSRAILTSTGRSVTDAELSRFILLAEGTKDFDITDRLVRIPCPILLLGAADDAVLGMEASMEIARILRDHPRFKFYIYNGYGHAAFDTAPDYKKRLLRFFLAQD